METYVALLAKNFWDHLRKNIAKINNYYNEYFSEFISTKISSQIFKKKIQIGCRIAR